MKKILVVTKHFKQEKIGGGAQKSIEYLVENLKDDFKINVVCRKTNSESKIVKKFKFFNTKYYSQFDLIYLNSFFSPLTIYFLFLYNSRCLISPKGELYKGALANKYLKKIIWIKVFNLLFKRKILFHATSKEEEILIDRNVEPKKIYVAPDIIKLDFSGLKKTNKTLKAVFVSRIELKKNLSFCIEVLSKVKRDISFEIYGDIGDKDYFTYCISELKNLPKNISYSYNGVLKSKNFNNNLKSEETSFHFDNPGGNIYHFYHSLDYFLKNYNAKKIILFLDGQSLKFNDKQLAYHTSLSPKISGNYLKFYFNYFKLFYNYKMIVSIILKESNIDLPDYFKGFTLETLDYSQTDLQTGDITFKIDKLFQTNKDSIYRSSIFEKRFQKNYLKPPINKKTTQNYLKKIKTLLTKYDLKFIVVIPPVYLDQSTNLEDIEIIKTIFDNKVLNFSNDSISNNKYFFKDYSHFNQNFGNFIFSKICFEKNLGL